MIVVKLQGGLGNQMFQYAMGRALSELHESPLELDLDFLLDRSIKSDTFTFRGYDLDVFSLQVEIADKGQEFKYSAQTVWDKIKSGFKTKHRYKEPFFQYDANALLQQPDVYLDGYWQSPNYFKNIEQQLRLDFKFRYPIGKDSEPLHDKINTTDSICVNIRRDDFLTNSYHGVCGMNYFNPAIELMTEKLDNPHLFVFTDDHQWCIDHFKSDIPMDIVGVEHNGVKYSNKLQLMTSCKHFIIPNSTFAWWAVWLSNKKDSLVIAPKNWFADPSIDTSDLIPAHWLRVEN
ncbi:MAG: hypothetical protein K0R51_1955 [Cytophagaceae bacterium]|jgi:hypothetical protein|nr:hypothetical protein [Cytophagaceae bacterium]